MDSNTTEDLDHTGTVTMISANQCAVSVNIGGTPETLSFGKRALYFWGNQCEGDMTNLLEENMEVGVRYKFSESQDKPSVVAVWYGDKPDLSISDEPAAKLYNQKGYVHEILDDGSFLIRCDGFRHTIVHKEVMYRDGRLIAVNGPRIAIGESVMFDAFPLESVQASGAMYQATCAWTGKEPGLVDRFRLVMKPVEQNLEVLMRDRVYGTVVVIANDVVALAEVDDAGEMILLFRSSFRQSCEHIQDVVKVGDRLCMRLRFAYIFGRQWFAVEASKNVLEVVGRDENISPLKCRYPIPEDEAKPAFLEVVYDEKSEVLYSDPPLQGILSFISKKRGLISYKSLWLKVRLCDLYKDGTSLNIENIWAFNDIRKQAPVNVNFEAVRLYTKGKLYKGKQITHEVTCVWIGEKPSLSAVANPQTTNTLLESTKNATYFGRVSKFYLPDIALVTVAKTNQTVYLHVNSFVSKFQNSSRNFISNFVKKNDFLSFNISQDPMFSDILRAVNINVITMRDYNEALKKEREHLEKLLPETSGKESDLVEAPGLLSKASKKPLLRDPPLQGIMRFHPRKRSKLNQVAGEILYDGHNIYVKQSVVFIDKRQCTAEEFNLLAKSAKNVNFEAVFDRAISRYYATCVWVGEKPSLSDFCSSVGKPNDLILNNKEGIFVGQMKGFYLPDVALVRIGRTISSPVVCLHLSEFNCEPKSLVKIANSENHCISDFVQLRGIYEFKVRKNDQCPLSVCACNVTGSTRAAFKSQCSLSKYQYCTGKSNSLDSRPETGGISTKDDPFVSPCNELSWRSIWGSDEVLQTGVVKKRNLNFVVEFVSSKCPEAKKSLDLSTTFPLRSLYVDGKPLKDPMSKIVEFQDRQITFYVARNVSEDEAEDFEELYIRHAWIGDMPELPILLKHKTVGFKRLFCPRWYYEGVVADFPLPTHAICEVGFSVKHYVLLPLRVDIKISNLRKGDKLMLKIKEQYCAKQTMFVSSLCTSVKKLYDDSEVLHRVRGKLVNMPCPVGKIVVEGAAPLEVLFDRSSVVAINGVPRINVFQFASLLYESVHVGAEVYFNAAKDLTLNNSYRAYEVWVGALPQ